MIEPGQICGVVHCTDPAHNCGACARRDYPGQLMPAECAKCCYTDKCQFEPKEVLVK